MRLLLAIIFSLIFTNSVLFAQENSPVDEGQRIISDQISAFLEGDALRAFSHAAPAIQRQFGSPEKFIEMVKGGYFPLYMPIDFRFAKSMLQDDTLYQQVIATDESGKKWIAVYTLSTLAGENWKITGVVMKPLKGSGI